MKAEYTQAKAVPDSGHPLEHYLVYGCNRINMDFVLETLLVKDQEDKYHTLYSNAASLKVRALL